MKALKVSEPIAQHILTQAKPEILAKTLRGWLQRAQEGAAKDRKA